MANDGELSDVHAALEEVAAMLDEMRAHLSTLTEGQALWVPPESGDVWPIQRSVTHCVNCEQRAVSELQRAMQGRATPQTTAVDTAIFAWFGPTPWALARMVDDLKTQVDGLRDTLRPQHMRLEAVRYPNHPARALAEYIGVMQHHTRTHLEAIRKKLAQLPPTGEYDADIRQAHPEYGRSGEERSARPQ